MYYYDIRILEDNDPHQILILCTHITVALELEHMEHDCWMQTDVVDILPSYIHPYTHTYIHTYIHAYDVCVCRRQHLPWPLLCCEMTYIQPIILLPRSLTTAAAVRAAAAAAFNSHYIYIYIYIYAYIHIS